MKHTLLYLSKLDKEGWRVLSPLLKGAFHSGYTFQTLREVLSRPNVTIDHLPPPPTPDVGDTIPSTLGPRPKADIGAGLPEYSQQALNQFLVEFIVENDQVRIATWLDQALVHY